MTIACKLILNGQTLYPELPVPMTLTPVGQTIALLNGGERFYYRKAIREWTLTLRDATEAERTTWLTAAAVSASVSFTDEHSTAYTCRVVDVAVDLTRTTPAVEGHANTTGPGFYDLSVTVRQIQ
jgi:hypothetical protein